jgi:hypothetical protein
LLFVSKHFQAKWTPVRVKEMRKNKNLEYFHVSMKRENTLAKPPRPGGDARPLNLRHRVESASVKPFHDLFFAPVD